MVNILIYPGSSSFTTGSTPFGYYDIDSQFRTDADKVTDWCAKRLGYPIENIELQDIQFYAAFEEAITVYGNEIYQWKIRENYLSYEGSLTGSNFNNQLTYPNLSSIIRLASNYGSEVGTGGYVDWHTGSIDIKEGIQVYDLNQWAISSSLIQSNDRIEIKRIFHENPPAIIRYFDPYAGTGTGIQSLLETFNFGSYSPGINFMLMPISFDLAKLQAIEFNDQIRKSDYSFELINNKLRIFPIPGRDYKLYIQYIKTSERNNIQSNLSGSNLITNVSNVPYQNPTYSQINSIGKMWIYQYTLALVKETLAYVRGKYTTVPIPGAEVTLNQQDLLTDARDEKNKLLEQLRLMLEDTSRNKQLEKKSQEEEYLAKTLTNIPLSIYIM